MPDKKKILSEIGYTLYTLGYKQFFFSIYAMLPWKRWLPNAEKWPSVLIMRGHAQHLEVVSHL